MFIMSLWSDFESALSEIISKFVQIICDMIYWFIGLFPLDNGVFFEKINNSLFTQYFKYIIWFVPLGTVLEIQAILIGFVFTVEVLYYIIQLVQFAINAVRG